MLENLSFISIPKKSCAEFTKVKEFRCDIITPLGLPVEPEVKRIYAKSDSIVFVKGMSPLAASLIPCQSINFTDPSDPEPESKPFITRTLSKGDASGNTRSTFVSFSCEVNSNLIPHLLII